MKAKLLTLPILIFGLSLTGCNKGPRIVKVEKPELHITSLAAGDKATSVMYRRGGHSVELLGLSEFAEVVTTESVLEATNVGSYKVEVSLKDETKYKWADGTTDNLVFTWNITKGDSSVIEASYIKIGETQVGTEDTIEITLPPREQNYYLEYYVKWTGTSEFVRLEDVEFDITSSSSPDVFDINDDSLRVSDNVTLGISVFCDCNNYSFTTNHSAKFITPSQQEVVLDKSVTLDSHSSCINYGADYYFDWADGDELISQDAEDDFLFKFSSSVGFILKSPFKMVRRVILDYSVKGSVTSFSTYCSKNKTTFVSQTGDVKISTIVGNENYPAENGQIVVDFTDELEEFDGSDYYLKFWSWANNSTDNMKITSLTVEYTAYLLA